MYRPTPPNPPVTRTLPGASVWREEASSVRTVTARRNEEPIGARSDLRFHSASALLAHGWNPAVQGRVSCHVFAR
eukprot:scaffold38043_cov54-Phaeocystis_antarctica.AAC.1